MPTYEIKGKGIKTGRKRKRFYTAPNKQEAIEKAKEDETFVEKITELPPEPATERQLSYAYDLGISVQPNATKNEVSDLISFKLDKDRPVQERHKKFGIMYGVDFTDYTGKKLLFNKIQVTLNSPGREKEILSWFIFRVYRNLVSGAYDVPIKTPDHPIICEIAEELLAENNIIKSVQRYQGDELIWFGEWTAPDGFTYSGGSKQTLAYKRVSKILKQRVALPKKTRKATNLSNNILAEELTAKDVGLSGIIIVFFGIFLYWLFT